MKLIIDINEIDYKNATHISSIDWNGNLLRIVNDALQNGTLLPKGHGRLIDGEEIASKIDGLKDNWNRYGNEYESGRYESYDYAVDEIADAPTIIEADKEQTE